MAATKIALKTVLNEIIEKDPSQADLTTKQMRVILRREFADLTRHEKNNAWEFTRNQADKVIERFTSSDN